MGVKPIDPCHYNNAQAYNLVEPHIFPLAGTFLNYYNCTPNFYGANDGCSIGKKFFDYFMETYKPIEIWRSSFVNGKKEYLIRAVYNLPDLQAMIKVSCKDNDEDYPGEDSDIDIHALGNTPLAVNLFYKDRSLVETLIADIHKFCRNKPPKGRKISLIIQEDKRLLTRAFDLKVEDFDMATNYGDDFLPVYNKISTRLNKKDDKGIVLFHGLPGTGKTHLLKYIAKHSSKEVLFVPPAMAESIAMPGFIPFLLEHKNSILIIEDAERVIASREDGKSSSQGVSNILNVSDGILGDCVSIQIVATFNTKRDKIDSALLRQGRLIAEHEFGKLPLSNTNKLLKDLGKNFVSSVPMTLADIYNAGEEVFLAQQEQSIGFNSRRA